MSKININNNIGDFFRKNKVRISAFALSTIMLGSLVACKTNDKNKTESLPTSISQQYEEDLLKLKANIEKNIKHIEVVKDDENKAYQITESKYKQDPIYRIDENGKRYIWGYSEEALMYYTEYTVSYEDAVKLEIDELLESKLIGYTKTK